MRENWVIPHVSKWLEEEVFCWNLHTEKAQCPCFNSALLSLQLITAFELLSPTQPLWIWRMGGFVRGGFQECGSGEAQPGLSASLPPPAWWCSLGSSLHPNFPTPKPWDDSHAPPKWYQPNLCCLWFFTKPIEILG